MFWCASGRDVVEVCGVDAGSFLHSQLSQDVASLAVGASVWSLLLAPTGRIDTLVRVWRTDDDRYVLDTDRGFGETMIARLNRFKIRVRAEISSLDWRCLAVRNGDVDQLLGSIVAWGGGVDLLGPVVEPPADAEPGSAEQFEDARIDACWPAMGAEIVPGETIPAETGIADATVSYTKGCYPGQELVERMDSRGASAPRHLVVLDRRDDDAVGADVVIDGVVVGTITSVGSHRVLARVRRGAGVAVRG